MKISLVVASGVHQGKPVALPGAQFLIGSTIRTTETGTFEGKEYPKFTVEISSKSHPFYTGEDRTLDKTGRVEKFKQRAARAKK